MKTLLRVIALALMFVAPCWALAQGYNNGGYGGASAPSANSPGGQNNYAPINNPVFTGVVTTPDAITKTINPPAGTYNLSQADCGEAIISGSGIVALTLPTAFEPTPGCTMHLYGLGGTLTITMSTSGGAHVIVSGGVGDNVNPTGLAWAGGATNHAALLRFASHLNWYLDVM
jgi:hypothetical protein